MKKFPWDCGDCPLLVGWDMSCDDMTYKCLWSKRQIDDCDRYLSDVCPMEKHDEEVIRKFAEWLMESKYIFVGRDGFTHDFHEKTVSLDEVLVEYEKEQKVRTEC